MEFWEFMLLDAAAKNYNFSMDFFFEKNGALMNANLIEKENRAVTEKYEFEGRDELLLKAL